MPEEHVTLEWFARNYHFTENQTRFELSSDALDWWPVIAAARGEAHAVVERQQQRMQARQGRR
jgi:hypothetical protein